MASAAAAAWTSTLLAVGSTAYSISESDKAASQKARVEESNAKSDEIERKRALIKSLAAKNVAEGAAGFTGASTQARMMADVKAKELDTLTGRARTSGRKQQIKSDAAAYKTGSLLSAAGEVANTRSRILHRGEMKEAAKKHD